MGNPKVGVGQTLSSPRNESKNIKIAIWEYYSLGGGGSKHFWPLFDFGINLLSWVDSLEFGIYLVFPIY